MEKKIHLPSLGFSTETKLAKQLSKELPEIVHELADANTLQGSFAHINPAPIPTQESAVEIIDIARKIIFPGYFDRMRLEQLNLKYRMGQEVTTMFQALAQQVSVAIKHDCYRYQQTCVQCDERGYEVALNFIRRLPEMRAELNEDVRAAYNVDPAANSYDEIIFCYPGLYAIFVYRLAHVLYHQEVPLLPRILTEYAHGLTGIDIHPGAHIGNSFFIDHGNGVVVGQTTLIGNRVRIYQGVTLGALSLPRDSMENIKKTKRHPTIEDDVVIYSGATILGGETIVGARSIIGGNTWITESVPPDTRVMLKSPELIYLVK